jgi:hypothetical protein
LNVLLISSSEFTCGLLRIAAAAAAKDAEENGGDVDVLFYVKVWRDVAQKFEVLQHFHN